MPFDISEFACLDQTDILEWWAENNLCHPGCPRSFKFICAAVYVLNEPSKIAVKNNYSEVQTQDLAVFVKEQIKFCRSFEPKLQTKLMEPDKNNLEDSFTQTYDEILYVKFYLPVIDKSVLVPLDNEYIVDPILVKILLEL